MRAVSFKVIGAPEVLKYGELPDPLPGPDEVVIRMKVAGVNFADIYRRRGEFTSEPPSPFVLGHEGAGVIHSVGADVKEFRIGDRVGFAHVPRSNAELVRAPAWKVVHLPDDISFEAAASILLQGLTAHYLTHDSYRVKAGDTVLVHSASGGVGLLLTQICKIKGARVVGTVSQENKSAAAYGAGADAVVVRSRGSWVQEVRRLTSDARIDLAYDGIGRTLNESLQAVSVHGTVVYFGWAGGVPLPINPQILMDDSKSLVGGELWTHIADRSTLLTRAQDLFNWLLQGRLSTSISEIFSLAEAPEAHRRLEGGTTTGKILLKF